MLDHTHHRPVTPFIRADRAEFAFGNIPAAFAAAHAGGRRFKGLGTLDQTINDPTFVPPGGDGNHTEGGQLEVYDVFTDFSTGKGVAVAPARLSKASRAKT